MNIPQHKKIHVMANAPAMENPNISAKHFAYAELKYTTSKRE